MAPKAPSTDLQILQTQTSSTIALLSQFTTTLALPTPSTTASLPPNPPNPLDVLHDASLLLRSHVTKISLLLLNKPFTASAITKILKEISATCLPALMSGVEICGADTWGTLLAREVRERVLGLMREMEGLLREVKDVADEEADGKTAANGKGKGKGKSRDTLASTGVVWAACDRVIALKATGIAGLAVERVRTDKATIRDAVEELREWGLDTVDSDEEDNEAGSEDEDDMDDIFGAANQLPADRADLRQLLDLALDRLVKVTLLLDALTKRRLKTVKSGEANVKALDALLDTVAKIPDTVDELASAFYDLDHDEAKAVLDRVVGTAKSAGECASRDWEEREDEFSVWLKRWVEVMQQAPKAKTQG